MTYLTLSVATRQECRINGTGPTTVISQTGLLKDIVDWVSQAYTEIQLARTEWRWLRSTFTVSATSGDDTYAGTDCTDSRLSAAVTRFSYWWPLDADGDSNVTIYLTSSGVADERPLVYLEWEDFRYRYKRGTQTNAYPIHFAIDPQNNLVLGPKPNATYTVNGEYQMSPQTLSANADVPEMPARFHNLIMYRAMEKYGAAKGAIEVFHRGGLEGNRLMRALERDQLPPVTLAGPLT